MEEHYIILNENGMFTYTTNPQSWVFDGKGLIESVEINETFDNGDLFQSKIKICEKCMKQFDCFEYNNEDLSTIRRIYGKNGNVKLCYNCDN